MCRTGSITPFWLRPAAKRIACVELHVPPSAAPARTAHSYGHYGRLAFGLCSAFPFDFISAVALLGSALLARARANAWSYETSSRQNGFTLIEALVVGIIGSILAGMFIAFMYVHNDAVNGGVARGILLTQSEIVSNRIAAAVRGSNGVFTKGDAWSPNPQLTPKATDTLICLRRPGDTIAIFRIGLLHRLREGTGLGNLPYFKTGRDTVSLVAGSSFWLSADRKRVTLNLTFTKIYRGKTYTLPSKRDSYLCRN